MRVGNITGESRQLVMINTNRGPLEPLAHRTTSWAKRSVADEVISLSKLRERLLPLKRALQFQHDNLGKDDDRVCRHLGEEYLMSSIKARVVSGTVHDIPFQNTNETRIARPLIPSSSGLCFCLSPLFTASPAQQW